MESTITQTNLFEEETFEAHLASFDDIPWFQDYKRKQWNRFCELGLPGKKDEHWRFASVGRIKLENYIDAAPQDQIFIDKLDLLSDTVDNASARLGIIDNATAFYTEPSDELRNKGVIFTSLENALREHSDLVREHIPDSFTRLGSDKFLTLHAAYLSNGTFLYVPKNVEIDDPFIAYHWGATQNGGIFPHSLIIAEDNAKVSCMDFLASASPDTNVLACSASSLQAGRGARVSRKFIQNLSDQSLSFHVENLSADRDAQPTSIVINLGCHYARLENQLDIKGSGASVQMYGLTLAAGKQEFDQRTLQIHKAPNTFSSLLYKNALMGKSRTIFSGLIKVEKEAQLTDAYQTNRNLQLSSQSEANSLPGLEILANDVKCSHGATTSRLDDSELFYMQARGIPPEEAKPLLVFGFFEEIIGKIEEPDLAESLRVLLHEKFDQVKAGGI